MSLVPLVRLVHLRWEPVEGASGYEIRVDGKPVATTGPRARTTKVSVGERTLIEIVDLPERSLVQAVDLVQSETEPEG